MNNKISTSDKIWRFLAKPVYKFRDKHPEFYNKHRDLIGSFLCGAAGAIATYVLMAFMPYIFGQKLAEVEILLPDVDIYFQEIKYDWSIIGFPIRVRDGLPIIGGGVGYSISYYFANFVSFLISYTFMRKFHHSKQNPYKQFFIGLAFCFSTTIITNMINGLWLPIVSARLTFLEYNIIVLGVIGVVNFFVGHLSNMLVYKDQSGLNKKIAKHNQKKKLENIEKMVVEFNNSKEINDDLIKKSAMECYRRNKRFDDILYYRKFIKKCETKEDYIYIINNILKLDAKESKDGIIVSFHRTECICPLVKKTNVNKERFCDCMLKHDIFFISKLLNIDFDARIIETINRGGNDCVIEIIEK